MLIKLTTTMIGCAACAPALLVAIGGLSPDVMVTAAITFVGFAGILIQQYFANKTALRNHEWDLAERQAKADLDARRAASTKEAVAEHAEELKVLINENTDISRTAFTEANRVNEKIASLGQRLTRKKGKS